jgi:hypothetical protein
VDDSEHGGIRPGAGAAPEPKAEPPHAKASYSNPAESFRRTQRHLTWRRPRRRGTARRTQATTQGRGDVRGQAAPLFRMEANKLFGSRSPEVRGVDGLPSQPKSVAASQVAQDRNSSAPGDAPDASPEFRSEFAALLAYYAARIAAARRGLPASEVFAAVQAILNEQTVALRALAERQAATQRQRGEKPERPAGAAQRKDEGPKPS